MPIRPTAPSALSRPALRMPSPSGAARAVLSGLRRLHRRMKNRRAIEGLVALDRAQLADLGLTRADVEAVLALPLSADPSVRLSERLAERRRNRVLMRLCGRDEG